MKISTFKSVALAVMAIGTFASQSARAAEELVVYCNVQEEWCRPMVTAFEKATNIKVSMTRKSAGETYAQLKAEAANPKADIWWGGTGDPHLQAAEEGLTESYKSPKLAELQPWAVKQAEAAKYRTVGIYAGALGYSYNTEELAKRFLQGQRLALGKEAIEVPAELGRVRVYLDTQLLGTAQLQEYAILAPERLIAANRP